MQIVSLGRKKNIISLSSAKFAHSTVSVKTVLVRSEIARTNPTYDDDDDEFRLMTCQPMRVICVKIVY